MAKFILLGISVLSFTACNSDGYVILAQKASLAKKMPRTLLNDGELMRELFFR